MAEEKKLKTRLAQLIAGTINEVHKQEGTANKSSVEVSPEFAGPPPVQEKKKKQQKQFIEKVSNKIVDKDELSIELKPKKNKKNKKAFVDNYNTHKKLDKDLIDILWTQINNCNRLIINSPSYGDNIRFIVHCTCTTNQKKSIRHTLTNNRYRFDQFLIGKLENTHELLLTFNTHYNTNLIIFVKITDKTKLMYLSRFNPENSSTELIFCAGSVFKKLGPYYYEFEGIDEQYIKNKEIFIKHIG
jgi:hypothetical protein